MKIGDTLLNKVFILLPVDRKPHNRNRTAYNSKIL